jgi:hypothetical protein
MKARITELALTIDEAEVIEPASGPRDLSPEVQ